MKWKKQIIALAIFALLFVTIAASENPEIKSLETAVAPQDGHYEGLTSQDKNISFNVVNGQIQNIEWSLNPTCNGMGWGFYGWSGTWYGGSFTWKYNINQDASGRPTGVVPNSNIGVFGYGTFDTSTHAYGGIWNTLTYFTGVGLQSASCFDKDITYEVNYVGQAAQTEPELPHIIISVT